MPALAGLEATAGLVMIGVLGQSSYWGYIVSRVYIMFLVLTNFPKFVAQLWDLAHIHMFPIGLHIIIYCYIIFMISPQRSIQWEFINRLPHGVVLFDLCCVSHKISLIVSNFVRHKTSAECKGGLRGSTPAANCQSAYSKSIARIYRAAVFFYRQKKPEVGVKTSPHWGEY